MTTVRTAAVIGSGMAGLACARALETAGVAVTIFDKGRRPGGRIATRRLGELSFDHGAQYATARGASFRSTLEDLASKGFVAPWPDADRDGETRWVGVPGMSTMPRQIALSLTATFHHLRHVAFLHRDADGWRVRHMAAETMPPGSVADTGGDVDGPFDVVVVAIPAPQAAPLLAVTGTPLDVEIRGASYAPCWAVMAAFERRIDAPDSARLRDGPCSWIAREASRPGRPTRAADHWVFHASPDWTRAHIDGEPDRVADTLLAEFAPTAGLVPIARAAHRWRYAAVETPLGRPCVWDDDRRIGACGDWCLGPRVEAAWDSGHALARAILPST